MEEVTKVEEIKKLPAGRALRVDKIHLEMLMSQSVWIKTQMQAGGERYR